MIETFAALLLAHVVADFLLQTNWMVETKRRPGTLLLHALLVAATAYAALGRIDIWEPLALVAAHILIDIVKTFALPARLWSFMTDQAAHLATLIALAVLAPGLFDGGLWADLEWMPSAMVLVAGLILAAPAGGYAIALLVKPLESDAPKGLPDGGRLIGLLERGMIFVLILVGQPAGIGFLIAAKSVLRFESAKSLNASEYVIIGTLASFGWAMIAGWATLGLLSGLTPLPFLPEPSP